MRKNHTRVPVGMLPERAPNASSLVEPRKDLGPFSGRPVEEFNQVFVNDPAMIVRVF
jgi:hypothetical protein